MSYVVGLGGGRLGYGLLTAEINTKILDILTHSTGYCYRLVLLFVPICNNTVIESKAWGCKGSRPGIASSSHAGSMDVGCVLCLRLTDHS